MKPIETCTNNEVNEPQSKINEHHEKLVSSMNIIQNHLKAMTQGRKLISQPHGVDFMSPLPPAGQNGGQTTVFCPRGPKDWDMFFGWEAHIQFLPPVSDPPIPSRGCSTTS